MRYVPTAAATTDFAPATLACPICNAVGKRHSTYMRRIKGISLDGPVVHLSSARLELEAADAIALRCRRLEVDTADGIQLQSDGNLQLAGQEMRVQTTGDIHLNGDVIRLNC